MSCRKPVHASRNLISYKVESTPGKSGNRKHRYWHPAMSPAPASPGLNAEPIIHGMPESLLATKVFSRGLHRYMTEQKLDLLQLAS